jgi:hypothetical protein
LSETDAQASRVAVGEGNPEGNTTPGGRFPVPVLGA